MILLLDLVCIRTYLYLDVGTCLYIHLFACLVHLDVLDL